MSAVLSLFDNVSLFFSICKIWYISCTFRTAVSGLLGVLLFFQKLQEMKHADFNLLLKKITLKGSALK